MSAPIAQSATIAQIKSAVCEAIERALPDGPVTALRIDVKLTNDGRVAKVILWPEIEYHVRPDSRGYKFS